MWNEHARVHYSSRAESKHMCACLCYDVQVTLAAWWTTPGKCLWLTHGMAAQQADMYDTVLFRLEACAWLWPDQRLTPGT